jgi:hypothetical protein
MLTYSPDGKTILAGFISDQLPGGHKRPEIQFLDAETGVLRDTWMFDDDEPDGQKLGGALQFSPDGNHLLVCFSGKPKVSVWQVEPKRLVWSSKIWNGWYGGTLVHWDRDVLTQFGVEDLIAQKRWGLDQKRFRTAGETRQPLVVP